MYRCIPNTDAQSRAKLDWYFKMGLYDILLMITYIFIAYLWIMFCAFTDNVETYTLVVK